MTKPIQEAYTIINSTYDAISFFKDLSPDIGSFIQLIGDEILYPAVHRPSFGL